jgi:hypothetical protein
MPCPFLQTCIVGLCNVFELLTDVLGILCTCLIILMIDVIDIAMIPVTDEPMEGVAIDVQDHARRTGTTLYRYTWGDD